MLTSEIQEVMEVVYFSPAISVIVPFEPKMGLTTELVHTMKKVMDKVESGLPENYPGEILLTIIK